MPVWRRDQSNRLLPCLKREATESLHRPLPQRATGELDEVQIRLIEERLAYHKELDERRRTILKTIDEQGKLTPELQARIVSCRQKTELEDLYLPYKPKRRTKATIAKERGWNLWHSNCLLLRVVPSICSWLPLLSVPNWGCR